MKSLDSDIPEKYDDFSKNYRRQVIKVIFQTYWRVHLNGPRKTCETSAGKKGKGIEKKHDRWYTLLLREKERTI